MNEAWNAAYSAASFRRISLVNRPGNRFIIRSGCLAHLPSKTPPPLAFNSVLVVVVVGTKKLLRADSTNNRFLSATKKAFLTLSFRKGTELERFNST